MKTVMILAVVAVAGIFLMTGCASCGDKDGCCAKPAASACTGDCCKDPATCAKCCTDAAGCAKCCKK
jgi:hypothetical protein